MGPFLLTYLCEESFLYETSYKISYRHVLFHFILNVPDAKTKSFEWLTEDVPIA